MKQSHKLVALLPIKAHSARVVGKNFRNFAGRPLFQWILDTLLRIDEVEKVVINTDARNKLEQHGLVDSERVLIRDRKLELCGDLTCMNKILADDISAIESEAYLMTHTTNPLLGDTTIRVAYAAYCNALSSGYDSLFSVNRLQTRFYRENGEPINHDPENLVRTQDLEPWFEENSNLYLFNRDSFAKTKARIGKRPKMFVTPHLESADIDDTDGWHLAEIIALANSIGESRRKHLAEAF